MSAIPHCNGSYLNTPAYACIRLQIKMTPVEKMYTPAAFITCFEWIYCCIITIKYILSWYIMFSWRYLHVWDFNGRCKHNGLVGDRQSRLNMRIWKMRQQTAKYQSKFEDYIKQQCIKVEKGDYSTELICSCLGGQTHSASECGVSSPFIEDIFPISIADFPSQVFLFLICSHVFGLFFIQYKGGGGYITKIQYKYYYVYFTSTTYLKYIIWNSVLFCMHYM